MLHLLLLAAALNADGALSLERIFADPPLDGAAPMSLAISPGAQWVTFLKPSPEDSEVLDLWALPMSGGAAIPLVKTKDLLGGGEEKLSEAERMERERKRVRHRGITQYTWCGKDDRALLFPLSGDLYHVALQGKSVAVARLTRDDEPELDARCDDAGKIVAFVKKGDLTVVDLKTRKERRLTKGASATKTFGVAEFIAAEEMDRFEGYWFSPDGARIAVLSVDESPVAVKVRPKIFADRTELFQQRYPAAGEANAAVALFVVDVRTGKMTPVPLPKEDGYLARVSWAKDALLVQWESRDQKRLVLSQGTAPAWKQVQILEEKDDAWVDLHDDLRPLADGTKLLWSSERTGSRQLSVVDRATGAWKPLAALEEPVREVVGVDEKRGVVYAVAGVNRGTDQQLFAIPLDGSPARRVTIEPGVHSVSFDDGGAFFVDKMSSWGTPAKVALKRADGSLVQWIDENPCPELTALKKPVPQWIEMPAEDGTPLNALLLPPVGLQKGKKYPVLVYTYGGPGAQTVFNGWMRQYPFFVWLTQRGYGVFLVDNRGMGGRDRAFARQMFHRFGDVEVTDLFRAVAELPKREAWVDASRIGVWGWSYGGYLSARAILDEKTPFAAAAAVAPVTEWRLYDTHYTERYLGRPQDPGGLYDKASLIPRAKLLKKPLWIAHGMADDNVLFENSLQLIDALEAQSLPFELMVYPGRAHGLSGRATQLHVYRSLAAFFDRSLK